VATGERQSALAERELNAAAEAVREWATQNPICPLCHAPIDPEVLLTHASTHD
jgi:hypothetical protein